MQCYAGRHKTTGHDGCQAVEPLCLAIAYNDNTSDQHVMYLTHRRKEGTGEGERKGGRKREKEGRKAGKEERFN